MKNKFVKLALATLALVSASVSYADEGKSAVIYLGVGSAQSGDPLKSTDTPKTIGFLSMSNESDMVWGFDIAGEGTMLDSTWGQNKAIKQATSYNFLLGKNLFKGDGSRFDASLLLGMRDSTTSCPSSYLGYQCYANSDPVNKYEGNYGAVLSYTQQNVMFGLRVTGQSTQALVGYKF